MNNLSTQPYKGTRDYYPEDKAVQNYIFDTWRRVVTSYGYREYGTPVLEPLDLYTAKSGEELAGEQTYQFTDRGDRVVAIRPEMTPSVSRLVAGRRQELAYPAKLFSIANFMRYERPQKGREREFWQLNVDSFGDEGVAADADILKLADNLLKAFGASNDQYVIKVNDRRLINEVMSSYLGFDSESSSQAIKLLDRKNKLTEDEFKSQVANILGDDKIEKLQALADTRSVEHLPSEVSTGEHASYIQNLLELLGAIGVESVEFDFTLVRGLDYYTGMVFEVFDTNPENNRSLFGGGRYDGLVEMFGAEPISAVGFAPGYTTTELFLRTHNLLPDLSPRVDVYVASLGDTSLETLRLADKLRAEGLMVESDTTGRKLDKLIKTAEKKNATEIVFVGENEILSGQFKAKNLKTGSERIL